MINKIISGVFVVFMVLCLVQTADAQTLFTRNQVEEIHNQVTEHVSGRNIRANFNDIQKFVEDNAYLDVDDAVKKISAELYSQEIATKVEENLKSRGITVSKDQVKSAAFDKLVEGISYSETAQQVTDAQIKAYNKANSLFNTDRVNMLLLLFALIGVIVFMIYQAKRGKEMFVRKIAGLNAIDEAVGRATEMGKPVLFVPGIYDMDDMPTIAGVTILGHVASKTAEYETNLMVPVAAPIVFSTAREVIKEAYLKVGRPDLFQEECVRFLTTDQFGYAAGCNGIMMRDKPATIFYMGTFYAESLILAETGQGIGAIQIAGTTQSSQLPFFVAACDYTLIGEELYAASAYFSREPMQLGSLKGQDMGKLFCMVAIVAGVLLETIAQLSGANCSIKHWFSTAAQ